MNNVVSIVNSQDAVGKSTTAWYLAHSLATVGGRKTLLVDCDPLSGLKARVPLPENAATGCCFMSAAADVSLATTAISERLDVLPGNADLVAFEMKNMQRPGRESVLRNLLDGLAGAYDCVVVDTPSSLGLLTVNALVASDSVIVPICCDYFGMDSVTEVMRTIKTVRSVWNERLRLEGLLLTRYDCSLRSSERTVQEYSRLFGGVMMNSVIRESDSPDVDYSGLTAELLGRKEWAVT